MNSPDGDYALLDSGDRRKLERFGEIILDRPAPQALWSRRQDASSWRRAVGRYERSSSGGGNWDRRGTLPEGWELMLGGMHLLLKPTGFGHLGVFVEQIPFWSWIRERCEAHGGPFRLLNLFGYTGGSTLAAASGGAETTHCDSSKGVVQWGRLNQASNGLQDRPIRWIVEDARKFVARELRRESRYHAIVLDPPSFGRGQKGELFKLEEHLPPLLNDLAKLLEPEASFLLLSAHTPGVGALALRRLLQEHLAGRTGDFHSGEMAICEQSDPTRLLPSGQWAAWCAGGSPPPDAAAFA